jgi:hypothetical protein
MKLISLIIIVLIVPIFSKQFNFQLHKRQSNGNSGDLSGGGIAYYTSVKIGTPPQEFALQVDTGSSYTVVVDRNCQSSSSAGTCPSAHPGYDPTASSSSLNVSCADISQCSCESGNCVVDVQYLDNSGANGTLYQDIVTVNELTTVSYLGGMYSASEGFNDQNDDGIMGFAYASLSDGIPTFMDALVQTENISDIFSMCLGIENGVLVLGGVDTTYFTDPIQWTPITKQTYYIVNMPSMTINGMNMDTSNYGDVIVDSGSAGMLVPNDLYNQMINAFTSTCSTSNNLFCGNESLLNATGGSCLQLDISQTSNLPTIDFTFQGTDSSTFTVSIRAQDYLIISTANGTPCASLGIFTTDSGILLGDTFMKAFYTVFDRENSRIGFAQDNSCGSDAPF